MIILKFIGMVMFSLGIIVVATNAIAMDEYNNSEEHFSDLNHGMEADYTPGFIIGGVLSMIGLALMRV